MGCGACAGVEIEVNEQQMKEIVDKAGDMMLQICCTEVLKHKAEEIRILGPPFTEDMRKNVADLREKAVAMQEAANEGGEAAKEAADAAAAEAAKAVGGGMFGKVAGGFTSALGSVASGAASLSGAGAAALASTTASALEVLINQVEAPFTEIGRDIVKTKQEAIEKAFADCIRKTEPPISAVRGDKNKNPDTTTDPPGYCWDKKAYDAVTPGALSYFLLVNTVGKVSAMLMPLVQDAVENFEATKRCKELVEKYNGMCDNPSLKSVIYVK